MNVLRIMFVVVVQVTQPRFVSVAMTTITIAPLSRVQPRPRTAVPATTLPNACHFVIYFVCQVCALVRVRNIGMAHIVLTICYTAKRAHLSPNVIPMMPIYCARCHHWEQLKLFAIAIQVTNNECSYHRRILILLLHKILFCLFV